MLYAAAGKGYAAEADDRHRLIQERRPGSRSLLDVACGTGAHLQYLANRYDIAGVDASANMLAEAAARLPSVPFVVGDMRSFDLGRRFDAVTCLFSAIGYMPSTADLQKAIQTMTRHLTERGVLVVYGWLRPEGWIDPGSVQALSGQDRTSPGLPYANSTSATPVDISLRKYQMPARTTPSVTGLIWSPMPMRGHAGSDTMIGTSPGFP